MKIQEKAALYDELYKDFEDLLQSIEEHSQKVENVRHRADSKNPDGSVNYAIESGIYAGINFGLQMRLEMAKSTFQAYKK